MANEALIMDLLRHGEPVGGRRYRGAKDDPLSELGWTQMREAVAGESGWQGIVTSPLQRCKAFAAELAAQRGIPLREEPLFREIGMGAWEGKTHAEIDAENPGVLDRHALEPMAHRPADAEPLPDFVDRVRQGWENVLAAPMGQHRLVVCHAGVIRASLCIHLQLPLTAMYRARPRNACLARFTVRDSSAGRVVTLNRMT